MRHDNKKVIKTICWGKLLEWLRTGQAGAGREDHGGAHVAACVLIVVWLTSERKRKVTPAARKGAMANVDGKRRPLESDHPRSSWGAVHGWAERAGGSAALSHTACSPLGTAPTPWTRETSLT